MDARDNGTDNPFSNTLYSLEWIASAMDAARRHMERSQDPLRGVDAAEDYPVAPGDAG